MNKMTEFHMLKLENWREKKMNENKEYDGDNRMSMTKRKKERKETTEVRRYKKDRIEKEKREQKEIIKQERKK